MRRFIQILIRCYQRFVSVFLGSHCRFQPSCSEYLHEAIRRKGLFAGVAYGIGRLLRCQPFCRGGWDPVPDHRCGGV